MRASATHIPRCCSLLIVIPKRARDAGCGPPQPASHTPLHRHRPEPLTDAGCGMRASATRIPLLLLHIVKLTDAGCGPQQPTSRILVSNTYYMYSLVHVPISATPLWASTLAATSLTSHEGAGETRYGSYGAVDYDARIGDWGLGMGIILQAIPSD